MKKRRCVVCGKPTTKKLCGWHQGHHDPVPDHHVAAQRACLRCGNDFDSTWSGDRICKGCRQQDYWNEKDAIKRGITPGTYDSPFEPDVVPGIGG